MFPFPKAEGASTAVGLSTHRQDRDEKGETAGKTGQRVEVEPESPRGLGKGTWQGVKTGAKKKKKVGRWASPGENP